MAGWRTAVRVFLVIAILLTSFGSLGGMGSSYEWRDDANPATERIFMSSDQDKRQVNTNSGPANPGSVNVPSDDITAQRSLAQDGHFDVRNPRVRVPREGFVVHCSDPDNYIDDNGVEGIQTYDDVEYGQSGSNPDSCMYSFNDFQDQQFREHFASDPPTDPSTSVELKWDCAPTRKGWGGAFPGANLLSHMYTFDWSGSDACPDFLGRYQDGSARFRISGKGWQPIANKLNSKNHFATEYMSLDWEYFNDNYDSSDFSLGRFVEWRGATDKQQANVVGIQTYGKEPHLVGHEQAHIMAISNESRPVYGRSVSGTAVDSSVNKINMQTELAPWRIPIRGNVYAWADYQLYPNRVPGGDGCEMNWEYGLKLFHENESHDINPVRNPTVIPVNNTNYKFVTYQESGTKVCDRSGIADHWVDWTVGNLRKDTGNWLGHQTNKLGQVFGGTESSGHAARIPYRIDPANDAWQNDGLDHQQDHLADEFILSAKGLITVVTYQSHTEFSYSWDSSDGYWDIKRTEHDKNYRVEYETVVDARREVVVNGFQRLASKQLVVYPDGDMSRRPDVHLFMNGPYAGDYAMCAGEGGLGCAGRTISTSKSTRALRMLNERFLWSRIEFMNTDDQYVASIWGFYPRSTFTTAMHHNVGERNRFRYSEVLPTMYLSPKRQHPEVVTPPGRSPRMRAEIDRWAARGYVLPYPVPYRNATKVGQYRTKSVTYLQIDNAPDEVQYLRGVSGSTKQPLETVLLRGIEPEISIEAEGLEKTRITVTNSYGEPLQGQLLKVSGARESEVRTNAQGEAVVHRSGSHVSVRVVPNDNVLTQYMQLGTNYDADYDGDATETFELHNNWARVAEGDEVNSIYGGNTQLLGDVNSKDCRAASRHFSGMVSGRVCPGDARFADPQGDAQGATFRGTIVMETTAEKTFHMRDPLVVRLLWAFMGSLIVALPIIGFWYIIRRIRYVEEPEHFR